MWVVLAADTLSVLVGVELVAAMIWKPQIVWRSCFDVTHLAFARPRPEMCLQRFVFYFVGGVQDVRGAFQHSAKDVRVIRCITQCSTPGS